jgi:hypothetical protein
MRRGTRGGGTVSASLEDLKNWWVQYGTCVPTRGGKKGEPGVGGGAGGPGPPDMVRAHNFIFDHFKCTHLSEGSLGQVVSREGSCLRGRKHQCQQQAILAIVHPRSGRGGGVLLPT